MPKKQRLSTTTTRENDTTTNSPSPVIYFDNLATTPLCEEAKRKMTELLADPGSFGNPGSSHVVGARAREEVEAARVSVARLINAEPSEIVFEGGATESVNHAIRGTLAVLRSSRSRGSERTSQPDGGEKSNGRNGNCDYDDDDERNVIVTTCIEHPAVAEAVRNAFGSYRDAPSAEKLARLVGVAGVNAEGIVDPHEVASLVVPGRTLLVTVMLANNETGAIQPVREIVKLVRERGGPDVRIHTDASQAVGKIPVDVRELGVDLLTIAGHKFGGPKGMGALYVRRSCEVGNVQFGAGSQEGGKRPGTENVLLIAGMGAAAEAARGKEVEYGLRLEKLRDYFLNRFEKRIPNVRLTLNGPASPARRLPGTISVALERVAPERNDNMSKGEEVARPIIGALLADQCSAAGKLCFSAGAACHSMPTSVSCAKGDGDDCREGGGAKKAEELHYAPSKVLMAMKGMDERRALATIRLSFNARLTTEEEIDRAVDVFRGVLAKGSE